MININIVLSKPVVLTACVVGMLFALGCGQLIDRDNIRIARIGDRYITRGDLFKLIRELPDDKKPLIRSRRDYLRILNQHIDSLIKLPLGRQLAAEDKIDVPVEVARETYFRESDSEEEQRRHMWNMEVPPPGVVTPLMEVYGLTPERLRFYKDMIEEDTQRTRARMLGEQAVQYLAMEALQDGRITISESEIEREYGFMRDQLVTFEEISFVGIRFPAQVEDAAGQAARLRDRLAAGEDFEALVEEFAARSDEDGIDYIIRSDIINNPEMTRFRGFWDAASGAQPGDIIGPVYMPAYQQVIQDREGRTQTLAMPDAYILFQVVHRKPERQLTLEEARPMVIAPLLTAKMMHLLREERGVEIYEDRLPEPAHAPGPTTTF